MSLPERERRILAMRHDRKTYAEIGAEMGLSAERVRGLAAVANSRLEALTQGQPNTPEFFYKRERFVDGNLTYETAVRKPALTQRHPWY